MLPSCRRVARCVCAAAHARRPLCAAWIRGLFVTAAIVLVCVVPYAAFTLRIPHLPDAPADGLVARVRAAGARAASPASALSASWTLLGAAPPFVQSPLWRRPPIAEAAASSPVAAAPLLLSPVDAVQVDELAAALSRLPFFAGLVAMDGVSTSTAAATPRLHLVTVASRPNAYLEVLQSSAHVFGWDRVVVLAVGDSLLGPGWGTNYGRKIMHTLDYVRALPPQDLVFFVDAHDVVVMGDAREAVEGFFRGLARSLLREPRDPACERDASPLPMAPSCSEGRTLDAADADFESRAAATSRMLGIPLGHFLAAAPPSSNSSRVLLPAAVQALGLRPELAAILLQPGRRVPTVLFSGETGCMDDLGVAAFDQRLTRDLRFCCLNSGQFAGLAGDLGTFLSTVDWASDMNDQATVYRHMAVARRGAGLPLGVVDHEADVFMSMWGLDFDTEIVLDPRSRRWRHASAAGPGPVFWHWNGWVKRTVYAVGLLTGSRGVETNTMVQRALLLGSGCGVVLLAIGVMIGRGLRGTLEGKASAT